MAKQNRYFLALELPLVVQHQLSQRPACFPASAGTLIKAVKPELLHLTLHFLGDQDVQRVIQACQKTEQAEFSLQLGRPGIFISGQIASVIWVALESGDQREVVQLHRALAGRLAEENIFVEKRRFVPHITIARSKLWPAKEAKRCLESWQMAPTPWKSREFVLLASTLLPDGSVYQVVERFALGRGLTE